MAIINNGSKQIINSVKLPTDFEQTPVVTFLDYDYSSDLNITVPKGGVENVDNKVTLQAILDDITAQVDAILAADYVSTQAVEAFAQVYDIVTNYNDINGDADWLSSTLPTYLCVVKLFVKTA